MLDAAFSPTESVSFSESKYKTVIDALNANDLVAARDLLLEEIDREVGDKRSWDSPYYTTERSVQEALLLQADRSLELTFFGLENLRSRYFLRDGDGVLVETPQDFFARVATGIACKDYSHAEVSARFNEVLAFAKDLYEVISQRWWMPATPVLTNIGTSRGLPISCFLNAAADSIAGDGGIFPTISENAVLGKGGGGLGTYWGHLRGNGAKLSTGGYSSGIIPFLKIQDSSLLAVNQAGARRGAGAVYLPISHPDIEEFLHIRRPTGDENRRCLNLHHGVCVDDDFMQAVEEGTSFNLVCPNTGEITDTVNARAMWKKLLMSRVETGEPYILFRSTVNRNQPEAYKAKGLSVDQSNLCVEITLPTSPGAVEDGGRTAVCCLGSVNAATYDVWGASEESKNLVYQTAVRALDNVLDIFIMKASKIPGYEKAVFAARQGRDIGLGVMGWFDYLHQRLIPFESVEARMHNKMFFQEFAKLSNKASEDLAAERGPAPDGGPYRNVNRQAIAPTASIGFIAAASACIEPWPGIAYAHKTLSGTFQVRNPGFTKLLAEKYPEHDNDETWKSIIENSGSVQHFTWLTDEERDVFKTAYELNQREIVQQAGDRQPYISQAQSLNLFFAPDSEGQISAKYLHDVHMSAWKLGVKSVYYCRSASVLKATSVDRKIIQKVIDANAYEECTVCQ